MNDKQELVATVVNEQTAQLDRMIDLASKQKDVASMERYFELKLRVEADEARKAYVAAMAEFKAKPLTITKDRHVNYPKKDGTVVDYRHASIGNVVSTVCARLGENGFSHRWDTKQDAGKITVTCVITHERGHSESTTLTASPDDSGSKNGIQAIASTISYLQRYTLLAATGLAASDMDDDGRGGRDEEAEPDPIIVKWLAKIATIANADQHKEVRDEVINDYTGVNLVPAVLAEALRQKKIAVSTPT